jgi:DNA-binding NarL/FixJ family response regulator
MGLQTLDCPPRADMSRESGWPLDYFGRDRWEKVATSLRFTPQEAKIVESLLCGMRDKQIASALRLSVSTVRSHLSRIFIRHKITDRVELVLLVLRRFHAGEGAGSIIKND